MLELSDKDVKATNIMLQKAITNMLGRNKNIVSLSQERENIKKNQMDILEL